MSATIDGLISQREASRQFGVNPKTLARRVRRGQLPTFLNPLDDRMRLVRVTDMEALKRPRQIVVTPAGSSPA
jgi:hypothetical protein